MHSSAAPARDRCVRPLASSPAEGPRQRAQSHQPGDPGHVGRAPGATSRNRPTRCRRRITAFKPTDSVRTFGQILAHVAGASYVYCLGGARREDAARGGRLREDRDDEGADCQGADRRSRVLRPPAYTSLTDRNRRRGAADAVRNERRLAVHHRLIRNVGHYQEALRQSRDLFSNQGAWCRQVVDAETADCPFLDG